MRIVVLLACLLALSGMPFADLHAQQDMSSIEGTVTNAAGTPVADVPVILINPSTGAQMTAMTDRNGYYRFDNVAPGRYTVRIAGRPAAGAPAGAAVPPAYERQYEVTAPGPIRVDISGDIVGGAVPLTDILTGNAVLIEMQPAQLRTAFMAPSSVYIPQPDLTTRDGTAYGALNLSVAVEAVSTTSDTARGITVAGGLPIQNTFRIDGLDNNNKVYPGPLSYVSNLATEQFTLFANQQTPVFGHASGGNFLVNTAVGTNEWHGWAYGYLQDDAMNAVDNRLHRLGYSDDINFRQWRVGGAVGFPIVHNKVFGYGNFEWIPLRTTQPFADLMFVPTAAGFTTLSGTPGVSAVNLGVLRSTLGSLRPGVATTTTTVAGRAIPLAPVTGTFKVRQDQYMATGGLDFRHSPSNAVSFRYIHNELTQDPFESDVPLAAVPKQHGRSLNAVGSWQHVFSPNVTNDLRLGYNRYRQTFPDPIPVSFPGLSVFPNIEIGSPTSLLLGPQAGLLEPSTFNTYQVSDAANWIIGRHRLDFGGDGMRYISSIGNLNAYRGNYIYSSLERYLLDLPPDVLAQRAFGSTAINDNRWLAAGWLHDKWRAATNFDLFLGVRYQFTTLPGFVSGDVFDNGIDTGIDEKLTNFSPHVGIAWAPWGEQTAVIRANFGMMYDQIYNPFVSFRVGQVIPQLGTTITRTDLPPDPGFLARGGIANPYAGTTPGEITPAQATALRTFAFTGQDESPYTMRWNAQFQTKIWNSSALTLGYLGTRLVHQPVIEPFASVDPALATFPVFFETPSQATLNSLTLSLADLQAGTAGFDGVLNHVTPVFPGNPLLSLNNNGTSQYHAGSAIFHQRFGNGALAYATYTYTNSDADFTGTPLDSQFGRSDGITQFPKHRATLTGMFDLGSLMRSSVGENVVSGIFANFNISGTYIYQTGLNVSTLQLLNPGLMGLGVFRAPNITTAGLTGGGSTVLRNSSGEIVGFLAPPTSIPIDRALPASAPIGARNTTRLDPVNNIDLSATKRFSFGDKFSIEARGTAYNLLNNSQFTGVPTNAFAFMNLTSPMAFFQPGNNLFGDPGRFFTNNARNLEVAVRVLF